MNLVPSTAAARALATALVGSAIILALQASDSALHALEYRRALLASQPWRLLSAHVVHVNWTHALVNAAAWTLLASLFAPRLNAGRQVFVLAVGALSISLALATWYPGITWYRGASGALHALFFAGVAAKLAAALRVRTWPGILLAAALFAGGWLKVALEWPHGDLTPYASWLATTTVPQAHFVGALAGTALGLLFAIRARQAPVSR